MSFFTRLLLIVSSVASARTFPPDTGPSSGSSRVRSAAVVLNRTIHLDVPSSPLPGRQVIDAAFQSYSIEFSYMMDFAGNLSHPNEFSYKMLNNLAEISGAHPKIRAGGSTQDRATWVENQTEAIIAQYATPGADQPTALTIGPAWLESFQTFPFGTEYIYGLSFGDGSEGLQQTLLEAGPAYNALGKNLYAFEIGNEPDGWPGTSRRPANWTVQSYVNQWLQYANAIGEYAIGSIIDEKIEPLYQAGAFEAPRKLGNLSYWNAESILRDGIAKTGKVKTISEHDYMGSACADTKQVATLEGNLLSHSHMTSLMWYHDYLSNYTVSQGIKYVLGETNSISCQGQANISDVFGAALWSIDYVLYVSTLHVSRLYFHMGTPYRYSAWQPIDINSTAAHPKALYYGNLFTSTALAGGSKQVEILVNETSFTVYGIYSAVDDSGKGRAKITDLVLVNLNIWNSTQPASERPYTAVKLPFDSVGLDVTAVTVRRLTAPGAETGSNITWAGRYVAMDGTITGKETLERVGDGNTVLVGASEAVLITL